MDNISSTLLLLFGFFLGIQLYYWLFIFQKADTSTSSHSYNSENKPISIIVCAHNEYNNLVSLLPNLLEQKYFNFEIILVDDRSDDQTNDLIKNINDHRFRALKVEKTPKSFDHKKHALNKGINAATNDYILLTDADCIPNSLFWIQEMQSKLVTNKEVVLGVSMYEKQPSLLNSFIQFETIYTAIQYLGFANISLPYMGVGRNLLYKKSLYHNNPLDKKSKQHTGGDDDLLLQQFVTPSNVSTSISYSSQTTSIPEKSLKGWFKQKKRHLKAGVSYPLKTKIVLGLLQLSHLGFYTTLFLSLFYKDIFVMTIMGYLLRTIILFSIFDRVSKRFGHAITKKEVLFGDSVYAIYFFVTGIFALISKRLKWK